MSWNILLIHTPLNEEDIAEITPEDTIAHTEGEVMHALMAHGTITGKRRDGKGVEIKLDEGTYIDVLFSFLKDTRDRIHTIFFDIGGNKESILPFLLGVQSCLGGRYYDMDECKFVDVKEMLNLK